MTARSPGPVACAQCGLTCAPAPRDGDPAFCCGGCSLVWHLTPELEGRGSDQLLGRLLLCAFLSMGVMVTALAGYGEGFAPTDTSAGARALAGLQRLLGLGLTMPVVVLLGVPLARAVISARRWLSADALIVCAVGAALLSSVWHTLVTVGPTWYETVTGVLVLVAVGRWLDSRTKERARAALFGSLPDEPPAAARVRRAGDTAAEEVAARELVPGDVCLVRPGEEVPADGEVVAGAAMVDTSALTGESRGRAVRSGDRVLATFVPGDGPLWVRVTVGRGESVRDEVERMLRLALDRPAACVRLADRIAGSLLPLVLLVAAVAGTVHGVRSGFTAGWQVALAVVLISCPCALGVATPLAFWVAIERLWRRGVLVRQSEVLERLARARRFLFDKTGTLSSAELQFAGSELLDAGDEHDVLRLAAALEGPSAHPIARAVRAACAGPVPPVAQFAVLPGVGVSGVVEGRALTLERDLDGDDEHTRSVLIEQGRRLAVLRFSVVVDPAARTALDELRRRKLELRVLTGDGAGPARALAAVLDVPVEHSLLPQDKARRVDECGRAGTVFVGDGVNDAAALAQADVGITVAGASALALRAGDVALSGAGLARLPELYDVARAAVATARFNLVWAFGYNAIGVVLAAAGKLSPLFAALAMVASSAIVVLHSARLRAGARMNSGADTHLGVGAGRPAESTLSLTKGAAAPVLSA